MPRPRSITPSQLAAAALSVIDHGGQAALTMRAVADELGMGVMSLYRYVESREALELLVVDHVLADVDATIPRARDWRRQVTILAERIRRAVVAHPNVVPLLLVHRHASLANRRLGEALLAVLANAGFGGRARVIGFRALLAYMVGAFQAMQLGPLEGAGTRVLAALPASEFPHLSRTARDASAVSAEAEFREGLAIVLRGLRAGRS